MAGIDGLSSGHEPPLRISHAGDDAAQSAGPAPRAQQLARRLDERLSERLSRIRAHLAGESAGAPSAPNPPGTGQKVDILA